jgi:hypothetical protein
MVGQSAANPISRVYKAEARTYITKPYTSMKILQCFIVVSVGVSGVLPIAHAAPARFWISTSGTNTTGPEAPKIPAVIGGVGGTAYVWAQPGVSPTGVTNLEDFSLDLVTADTNPVIAFQRDKITVTNSLNSRFEYVADSSQGFPKTTQEDDSHHGIKVFANSVYGIRGVEGYSIHGNLFTGIGLPCDIAHNCTMTSTGPAWLVASIGFQALQSSGMTNFNLQIGYEGIQYLDTSLPPTAPEEPVSVLFGTDGPLFTYTYNAVSCPTSMCETEITKIGDTADLTIQAVLPPPGDYNGNGIVDAADYTVWRDTLGSTTDLRANGDSSGASAGVIDQADYNVWKTNFGAHAGSGSDVGAAVPEPATLWIFLTGILTVCSQRCHKLINT